MSLPVVGAGRALKAGQCPRVRTVPSPSLTALFVRAVLMMGQKYHSHHASSVCVATSMLQVGHAKATSAIVQRYVHPTLLLHKARLLAPYIMRSATVSASYCWYLGKAGERGDSEEISVLQPNTSSHTRTS